jgi:hypothetical protein
MGGGETISPFQEQNPWNANSGPHYIVLSKQSSHPRGGLCASFFDWQIVAVYLWAVVHDRPTSWACNPKNWPKGLWQGKLPTQSTMSRRLRTTETQSLLHKVEREMATLDHSGFVMLIDGKPLAVGGWSKDRDARWGRAGKGWAKGYKVHAVYGRGNTPLAWEITALNEAEPDAAARLIPSINGGGGYLVGDSSYDSNPLHDTAASCGYQLIAKRKRPGTALGHRRHSPYRLRSIALLDNDFGRSLWGFRGEVERKFAWLTNHAGGLPPLPNWVRRKSRVKLWVQAKLIIHAMYEHLKTAPTPIAVA